MKFFPLKLCISFFSILIFSIPCFPDTIYFKDGEIIENVKNIVRKGKYIYFEIEGWEGDTRQYNVSYIDRIERGSNRKSEQKSKTSLRKKPGNPVALIHRSKVEKDVKKRLAKQYPDNYTMQKLVFDSNMEGYDFLTTLPNNDVNNRILSRLLSNYYPNFIMIKLSYEHNMKSYKALHE